MRLTHKQRHKRMRNAAEEAWQQVEALPASIRDQAESATRLPIEIVACPLGKEVNQGGILRLAEAFRIERVTFSPEADEATDFSGHRGAVRWQPFRWVPVMEALEEAKGTHRVALTINDRAKHYKKVQYRFPMILVVGSEMEGIPAEVSDQCDDCVAIPMYGLMGSLNVATATAIVLEHIAEQCAAELGFEPIRDVSKRLLSDDR